MSSEAVLKAVMVDGKNVVEAQIGAQVEIILDRTPFYAQGGGQLADGGRITLANGAVIEIDDVQCPVPGLFVHRGEIISGGVKVSEKVLATIDRERRLAISRAHTATHMVHKAFREALGESATQAGSENSPGRFRFDFPATGAVSQATLSEVESRVNTLLLDDLEVTAKTMTQPEAKSMGAMALFGEKYGDQVRVVSVGDWAHELCGGTHVDRSGQLGVVKLLSEASIGAGVRRVEALVGVDAYSFLAREHLLLNSLTELMKGAKIEELPERISDLLDKLRIAEKDLAGFKTAKALASALTLLSKKMVIGSLEVLAVEMDSGIDGDDLRTIALDLRNRLQSGVVVLISKGSDRATLVVATSPDAVKSGVRAGELVKAGSAILGGGGGGKDDFAQGGGSTQEKCGEALDELVKLIGTVASR
jgi:alanyl-tRNA synthetase